jgi:uncharacterized integral membrane protein (TIGR00697 family)
MKPFKYLTTITAFFAVVLLISNIASSKLTSFWGLTLDAGTILFPLTYIFNDILTEVYGYRVSRRVIWIGFGTSLLASIVFIIVGALPPSPDWGNQGAYEAILGLTPRIVIASLFAYLIGEFSNSYILAKMKIKMGGKKLWVRTIGSTLVGQLLDSTIFILIAFLGVFPNQVIISLIVSNYIFKVGIEVLMTPITYKSVSFLKKKEGVDVYDMDTKWNPFNIYNI